MNIGDKLILKPGNKEGTITRLLNNQYIEVTIENCFKISVLRSEVAEVNSVKTINIEKLQINSLKRSLKKPDRRFQKNKSLKSKIPNTKPLVNGSPASESKIQEFFKIDPQDIIDNMYRNISTGTRDVKQNAGSILYQDYEVDLHIEEIIKRQTCRDVACNVSTRLQTSPSKMNSSEILDLQLSTFENALEKAIACQMNQIVFIHGVGKSILRNELHKRLKQHKDIINFENPIIGKYGYGATLVIIR
ncbi:MAG: Smr/MutS family protein [Cytophagales bacterium]|nr:Smr/MutS family protein [Cytophagales bacterium]